MSAALRQRAEALDVGDSVLAWPGLREGPGYLMFVAYKGVHEIGGQECLYLRPMGSYSRAIALTHIEIPADDGEPS
jgi:hypothetical protein